MLLRRKPPAKHRQLLRGEIAFEQDGKRNEPLVSDRTRQVILRPAEYITHRNVKISAVGACKYLYRNKGKSEYFFWPNYQKNEADPNILQPSEDAKRRANELSLARDHSD